uniref:Peptide-methionine (S)-S-oxide reductase n=1 Tax=Strombidinopsis acuminata TaxID=141414 RepID=A0A7S3TUX2_9SPIT
MGHTEVVNVSVPADKVGAFAKKYFDDASRYPLGRADPQDRGGEYRSAIGIPGGMDGPLFKEVEAANAGRMELVRGQGNDGDTVATKKVWVYDSNKFPFYQGEVYHQFHDDMGERYSKAYHGLKDTMLTGGAINKVQCPEVGF